MWSGFVWTGFRFKAPTPGLHVAMQVIGVDPNLGDYDNRTALHLAASNGHLETITRMLEFGYLDAWWQEAHKHTDTDTDVSVSTCIQYIYKSLQIPQMFKIMHAHKHTEPGSTEC